MEVLLMVDDDSIIRHTVASTLSGGGDRRVSAADGQIAPAAKQAMQLLIPDMPESITTGKKGCHVDALA